MHTTKYYLSPVGLSALPFQISKLFNDIICAYLKAPNAHFRQWSEMKGYRFIYLCKVKPPVSSIWEDSQKPNGKAGEPFHLLSRPLGCVLFNSNSFHTYSALFLWISLIFWLCQEYRKGGGRLSIFCSADNAHLSLGRKKQETWLNLLKCHVVIRCSVYCIYPLCPTLCCCFFCLCYYNNEHKPIALW